MFLVENKYRKEKVLFLNVIFPWNIVCKLCQKQKSTKKKKKAI